MLYKQDWETVKKRFELLWQNEILDRCCVSVPAPLDKNNPYIETPPTTQEELKKWYTDPEWILKRNEERFQKTYFGGDALPCIFPYFGTGGHGKYLSNTVQYSPDTIWMSPAFEDYDTFDFSFQKNNNDVFRQEVNTIALLAKEGQDRFFVGSPDNCGSYDALAQLRGESDLLFDMMDKPDKVKHAAMRVVDVLLESGDALFEAIQQNNYGGSIHGGYGTWAPGRHWQLQCDISVMISPEMFREFIMEELRRTAEYLDFAIYHMDGIEQIRFLDDILSIKEINMIQWVQVTGQPPAIQFVPELKKIQAAGKGIVIEVYKNQIKDLMEAISPKGLYLRVIDAATPEEADDIVRFVQQNT